MSKEYYDLAYLCKCAVNSTIPSKSRLEKMDMEQVYNAAKRHSLTGIAAYSLESAGVQNELFRTAKAKSARKNILLDFERKKLFSFCEEKGIWYMPLKGCILKDMYPDFSMRQMADNDILFDPEHRAEIKEYFKADGYRVVKYNQSNHDIYEKPPILNFEMHTSLFGASHNKKWTKYYKGIKDKLIKDSDNNYGYHFSDEDFYIYIVAHEYKHYINGGTGIRSLLDRYIYLKAKQETMNWSYISDECRTLEIADFEQRSRELSQKVFGNRETELSDEEKTMFEYYLKSGTYGSLDQNIKHKMDELRKEKGSGSKIGAKLKYIRYRVFPPIEVYEECCPTLGRHKLLLPAAWAYRFVRGMITKRKKVHNELRSMFSPEDKKR